jgi:aminoglycoside 3-N-acetyltransferase I
MEKEIQIKRIDTKDVADLKKLVGLFNSVFEIENNPVAGDRHLGNLLRNPHFIALSAKANQKIIGGLPAYELPAYTGDFSEMYIYDIAVKSNYQRKGIGKMLIEELKVYCHANSIKTVFVEAHEKDTHAVDFYHAAKATAEKVVHFNFDIA